MTLPRVVGRNRYNSGQIRMIGSYFWVGAWLIALVLMGTGAQAQVNVLTAHNDTARTGQNLNETILTPSNVNTTQFGKLFTYGVTGAILAQPLYVQGVTIGGNVHNVVYVATTSDYVYAFDADTNGGANANPLWQASLLTNSTPAGTLTSVVGVWGTPVIDPSTKTMYLVSSEIQGTAPIFRFHALDITTGAEIFGGPLQIKASAPGTGVGSTGGVVTFDPTYHRQRPGLLLLNGVVYASFGSVNDEGPWHGWIFSYAVNPTTQTLQQVDIFCLTPNGSGAGLWMGGAALAGEVNNPAKPYGRLFVATGNGTFGIGAPTASGQPYSNPSNEYGMSVLDLDLSGGVMTVEDLFTPYNEAFLNGYDLDTGSGGPVLLPTQTLASGKTLNPLVQVGKVGMFYILDRDNNTDGSNNAATEYSPAGLGGFSSTADQVVQEFQTPIAPGFVGGAGVWGTEAYWNNTIYSGGTTIATTTSGSTGTTGTPLSAYSFVNGVISSTPTSQSVEQYFYPGPTPSISAKGNTNGILWTLNDTTTNVILEAYDATNLANLLYSDSENLYPAEYAVPTIANGKVYVGTSGFLIVYGLLAGETAAPSPVITPGTSTFNSPITVTITDPVAGATIYYTTNGSTPTTGSTVYSSTNPPVVSTPETITAIASIAGYLQSAPSSATYTSTTIPANPVFSLAAGTYTGTQTLTITEPSLGAVVYYTVDGSAPTTTSLVYTRPLTISASQTVQAVAVYPGPIPSAVVSAAYTIQPAGTFSFSGGFALADGPIQFNGSTDLDDFRLQLTNGGTNEAGSAFYATPVNIQQFTTNFTFQLSNPSADGITFTIQGNGPTSLGGVGGQLGYGGIPDSVAIKFDIYNSAGEGSDSTGLYINGAIPTTPAIDLTPTGINLHNGDYFNATLTYDGSNLTLTLTDAITLATWSHVFVVNIPAIVGGNTAYVGFTGGTGGLTSSQKLTSWTYVPGPREPTFQQMPGSLHQISVGTDGSIWGINSADSIFFYNSQTQAWQMVPGWLSQIAVGAKGYIWGLNSEGNIYRFDPATQNWDSIPGSLSQIAVGADGDVWGINSDQSVYHYVWAAQGWEYIPATLTQIAVGFDGAVWGLGSAGNSNGLDIYRFNVGTRLFEQVPGELSEIAVGADGDVWGLNAESSIYHFNTLVQNWEQIPGSLSQISVGSATNVWGLNSSGNVYTFNSQAQNWMQIAGTLKQISAGANGSVWGVDSADNIYQFIQPLQPTNAWHAVPDTSLTKVAVGVDGNVWALDGTDAIYHYNPRIQNWENVPGWLSQIAVGFGGEVWGIDSDGFIYRYNTSIQNWENVAGWLSQIAVGANGDVWGINSGRYIYRFDRAGQTWEWIPGELTQLSVGADGAVWGINASSQIFRYDQQIQGWDAIPGWLSHIAVGSSSNIWGLNAEGYIFQFNKLTQNWDWIPGNLSQIAIGFDGTVWGINSASQIFRYDSQAQTWDYVPGSLNQITVGADAAVWGVNSTHGGYRFW